MNKRKKIHFVCNAHLDPVWLWRWDEGAAEAISTFRVAAEFCEKEENFVFNHNEAILYQWIEEYEPELFERIKKLVAAGKWHIMGGWYLQPDCNMPNGEGLVRQIAAGRQWFYEKFGVLPRIAVNVDSFGHSRGLVQIMKKSGYEGYLFCRPLREFLGKIIGEWGFDTFVWKGYDESEIIGHRHFAIYNSPFGKADKKLDYYLEERGDKETGLLLWGIGNHGGGPSRVDLKNMNNRIEDSAEYEMKHSIPEAFFEEVKGQQLPQIKTGLNPWAVGGYTTQGEVKRKFRKLESEFFLTEKLLTMAWITNGLKYPEKRMQEAEETLLFAQFHDIIPGTLVPSALEDSICHIDRGLDILQQEKTKAFFSLAKGQTKAEEGSIPLLVFNPHPYPIEGIFGCEFHMNQTFSRKQFLVNPHLYHNGKEIPCQLEQEESQMPMQWRRKVVFHAVLEPMAMNRFDCKMQKEEKKAPPYLSELSGKYEFCNERIYIRINTRTGLLDSYQVDGKEYLKENAFVPLIMADDDHSIGTFANSFREEIGRFTLLTKEEASLFAGTYGKWMEPVHMTEDGEIRTVIEAMFGYGNSRLCMRYLLPKKGTEVEIEMIVHWNEKSKMLKLAIPSTFSNPVYLGETVYGYEELADNGSEVVSQRWNGLCEDNKMFSLINDRIYGSSLEKGEMRATLLRSPRYGCLAKESDRYALYNEGYVEHTDQGVHHFHFWMNAGEKEERLEKIEREAIAHHEKPYLLSFFPSGTGKIPDQFLRLEGKSTVLTAMKPAVNKRDVMFRLFHAGEGTEEVTLHFDFLKTEKKVLMKPFEVKTCILDIEEKSLTETDLLENQYSFGRKNKEEQAL